MATKNYQTVLSFGYLYIVVLGIFKEAFHYSQLGIDYFKYASIADILISPLSDITQSITSILFFLLFAFLAFFLPTLLENKHDKPWVKKAFKLKDETKPEEFNKQIMNIATASFCLGLLGFYLGAGLGSGGKLSKQIEKGELKYEDKIEFLSGETDTINMLGKNSSFLFYIEKGKKEIEISPINNGNIKSIIEKKED